MKLNSKTNFKWNKLGLFAFITVLNKSLNYEILIVEGWQLEPFGRANAICSYEGSLFIILI